jgi:hypothetical protein
MEIDGQYEDCSAQTTKAKQSFSAVTRETLSYVPPGCYVQQAPDSHGGSRELCAPIILGRCPSLSAHESESMLRNYLICKEKQERKRERNKQTARGRSTRFSNNSDPFTSTSRFVNEAK